MAETEERLTADQFFAEIKPTKIGSKPDSLHVTAARDGGYVVEGRDDNYLDPGDVVVFAGTLDECLRYVRLTIGGKDVPR
jgi:hypothetical protein